MDAYRVGRAGLFRQINAKSVSARGDHYLIAWVGRFDFGVGIARADADNGGLAASCDPQDAKQG